MENKTGSNLHPETLAELDLAEIREITLKLLKATHDVYNKVCDSVKSENPWYYLSDIRSIVAKCHYEVDEILGVPDSEPDRTDEWMNVNNR